MATDQVLEIVLDIGTDWAAQIFWTDEYGAPVVITDPVLMDVKDANGQIALRFSGDPKVDPETDPYISYAGLLGFFQLTVPAEATYKLTPGRYEFDLFAAVADASAPFTAQRQKVVGGFLTATRRITQVEADTALLSAFPLGS